MITKKEMNPKDLMKTRMYLATIRKQFIRKQQLIQNNIAELNRAIAVIDSQMEKSAFEETEEKYDEREDQPGCE